MRTNEIVQAVQPVIEALTALGVSYRIGGSVASSALGVPRSTLDIDIVCELEEPNVATFVSRLEPEYYVDADMIKEAIRRRASFNLVHLGTMMKVDVFIHRRDAFGRESFGRVVRKALDDAPGTPVFDLTTAEDIILRKLEWYELGGRVSERQWLDAVGVIAVQRELLDRAYLERWAKELGLNALLERALKEGDAR